MIRNCIFISAALLLIQFCSAQTPQWNWVFSAGGLNDEYVHSVSSSNDLVFAVGSFNNAIQFDTVTLQCSIGSRAGYVAAFQHDKSLKWVKTITGGEVEVRKVSSRNNYVFIAGTYNGGIFFDSLHYDSDPLSKMFVCKFDQTGNLIWFKNFQSLNDLNNPFAIGVSSMVEDGDSLYITGYFTDTMYLPNDTLIGYGTVSDGFLLKLNSSGNELWAHAFLTDQEAVAIGVDIDSSLNVYVNGKFAEFLYTATDTLTSFGESDVFLSKLDANGNEIFNKHFGGTDFDLSGGLKINSSGLIALNMYTYANSLVKIDTLSLNCPNTNNDIIALFNLSGNLISYNFFSSMSYINAGDITSDLNGNFYFNGVSSASMTLNAGTSYFSGLFTFKMDSAGSIQWGKIDPVFLNPECICAANTPDEIFEGGNYSSDMFLDTCFLHSYGDDDLWFGRLILPVINETGILNKSDELNIFPNPGNGLFTISKGTQTNKTIIIRNSFGQEIYSMNLQENSREVDIRDLSKGVYYLEVRDESKTLTRKIIIE
jgi:hypothetical protein